MDAEKRRVWERWAPVCACAPALLVCRRWDKPRLLRTHEFPRRTVRPKPEDEYCLLCSLCSNGTVASCICDFCGLLLCESCGYAHPHDQQVLLELEGQTLPEPLLPSDPAAAASMPPAAMSCRSCTPIPFCSECGYQVRTCA
jgi:hypothetical protein